ncbi:thioredoxin family protein [Pseudogemmatithrix spongiicola]|uniref:Thioredoxin family protein n=1 Tax=Pseudogemmatithrix spongiicola TaxID=3062599 RepID=A0AA49JSB3_9BACT|nr:thioredoxin family protein [Gemmatimonadaceae bacterium 'strain 138']WKW13954.1 thioredoxin family protein [Gemmatimonadaceae bacterium 'strain 318']
MVRTASTMLELGTKAPDFSLPRVEDGRHVALSEFAGAPATLVVFLCAHCPYVKHVAPALATLVQEYQARGVAVIGISSNDATAYPDDAPEALAAEARERGYTFPILYDESQAVAKAYRAACTPDFYLFDRDLLLAYRGQFDASRPKNDLPVTGADLRAALDAVLAGAAVPEPQVPSIGCNIKWKQAPEYFTGLPAT